MKSALHLYMNMNITYRYMHTKRYYDSTCICELKEESGSTTVNVDIFALLHFRASSPM